MPPSPPATTATADLLDAPRGADDHAGHLLLQLLLLGRDGHPAEEVADLDATESRAEALELVADLRARGIERRVSCDKAFKILTNSLSQRSVDSGGRGPRTW